jgi:UDP-N-acetylmuramoyl-tripeptide--D-alanyl-D-alanine ligase
MKSFVQKRLAAAAKKMLVRYAPEIIGVTGSVGKSSTKQAIGAVLGKKFSIRISPKNYNTEFGVPLTILDLPTVKSPLAWSSLVFSAWQRAAFGVPAFPKTLVLEMATDRPGDIAVLTDIAPPSISVVTTIGESHAEFFGSIDAITQEKATLVTRLKSDGWAVLNRDDARVWEMRKMTQARVKSYGFTSDADVSADLASIRYDANPEGECGMHFMLSVNGETIPAFLPGMLGRPSIYAALAAAAVGVIKGMALREIANGVRDFAPAPGRMRCLSGIKRTILIDDTYNAAPRSTEAALETLRNVPATESVQRFVVLGDMLELGALSEKAHEEMGKKAAASGADVLVFVGERMGDAEKAALAAGMSQDRVFHFSGTEEAGRFIQNRMKQGDVVLVKGSRGMRMERVVKELMADPMAAERLLVEADESWKV